MQGWCSKRARLGRLQPAWVACTLAVANGCGPNPPPSPARGNAPVPAAVAPAVVQPPAAPAVVQPAAAPGPAAPQPAATELAPDSKPAEAAATKPQKAKPSQSDPCAQAGSSRKRASKRCELVTDPFYKDEF